MMKLKNKGCSAVDPGWIKNILVFVFFLLSVCDAKAQLSKDNFYTPEGTALYGVNIFKDQFIIVPDLLHDRLNILNKDLQEISVIEGLSSPHEVAVFKDQSIYVGGHRSGRVYKFDGNFKKIKQWDHLLREKRLISCPSNVAVGPQGNVYISDWVLHKIIKVNDKGEYLLTFDISSLWSDNTSLDRLINTWLGKPWEGQTLGDRLNHKLFGRPKPNKHSFMPHGVWAGNDRVYVADLGFGAIHVFTQEGKFVESWPRPTSDFLPWTIRPLSENYFAVPNKSDNLVYIFNKSGRLLKVADFNEEYPGVRDDPNVDVLDNDGNLMKIIDRGPSGLGVSGIVSLVTDKDGDLYLASYRVGQIRKVDYKPLLKELELLDEY